MKLITLNAWGGRIYEPQMEFLKKHIGSTDIFCLQEVYNGQKNINTQNGFVENMFSQYTELFKNYEGFYAESLMHNLGEETVPYGIAIFYKKETPILAKGEYEVFKKDEKLGLPEGQVLWNRMLQYISIPYKDKNLNIFNLHGLYTGGGKEDTVDRLLQSQRVKDFMASHEGEKILCGDFNLNPKTKSMVILAEGMINLIDQNNITSTRSHYYPKEEKFADYILVSPGLEVKKFEVLQDVVSDHLPLVLEF